MRSDEHILDSLDQRHAAHHPHQLLRVELPTFWLKPFREWKSAWNAYTRRDADDVGEFIGWPHSS